MLSRFHSLLNRAFHKNWNINITRLVFALAATATIALFSFTREELDAQNLPELPSRAAREFGSEATVGKTPPKEEKHFAEPLPVDLVEERPSVPLTPVADTDAAVNDKSLVATSTALDDKAPVDELNVKDADVTSLIQLMSKKTGRNYIIDSAVKGKKVTIYQPTKITVAEALRIFESVLLLNGLTTVPVGENIYKVISAKDAKTTTIPLLKTSPDTPSDALVTQLIRLKNVAAQDVQQILAQFVSRDGMITASPGTNGLVLIDSAANIERLIELVQELDVPAKDQDITIIPIVHADAKDIAEKIGDILGVKDGEDQGSKTAVISPTRSPTGGMVGSAASAPSISLQRTAGDFGERRLPLKIIPDERTNALIVVADVDTTAKVRALTEQLDSPVDLSGGKFYVYRLQHADAEDLASILSDLISGNSSSTPKEKTASTGSSLSRSSRNRSSHSGSDSISSGSSNYSSDRSRYSRGQLRSGTSAGDANASKVNFEGEVSVVADPSTNSLIISASKSDYARLKEIIEQLDTKRRQVLVEATILEVRLDKTEGMGVELQGTLGTDNAGVIGQTNFGGLTNVLTNPAALSDLSIAAASSGTLTLPGGLVIPSQAVLLSAVSRNSNVNVLSSPTILTTDNEEAEIIVGENVPFVTGTSTDPSNLNNRFNDIERQDVGITLRITPQISSSDFVTLRVFVEISNVVQGTQRDANGPTTTIRTTETNVEVKDSQMIVTGGLLSDNVTTATRGVPFLQDIPFFGNWMKREDTIQNRTNLLIFITPKVINDQFDLRESTIDHRNSISEKIGEDIEPEITDALQSKNIDNVAESLATREVAPTTATPADPSLETSFTPTEAKDALERTKDRLRAIAQTDLQQQGRTTSKGASSKAAPSRDNRTQTDSDVLTFSVKPKLPGDSPAASRMQKNPAQVAAPKGDEPSPTPQPSQSPQPSSKKESPPAESKTEARRTNANPQGTYVVLRDISPSESAKATTLPFSYANDGRTVGIVVPSAGGSQSASFFTAGGQYTFELDGIKKSYICLGRYSSVDEAKGLHERLSNDYLWYPLTPGELLTLGTGRWKTRS